MASSVDMGEEVSSMLAAAAAAPHPPLPADNTLQTFFRIEEELCQTSDHLAMLSKGICYPNHLWREVVCKWMYDLVDNLGEARSVVHVAMNILDRFCAVEQAATRARSATQQAPTAVAMNEQRYECASMTAVFLAARVAGGNRSLKLTDLILMSRGSVRVKDIVSMGKEMLRVLTWGARIITPVDFLRAMLPSLPASVDQNSARTRTLFESASFLAEISVCDIYLSQFPPSQIAFAAMLNAAQADDLLSQSETEIFCQSIMNIQSCLPSSSRLALSSLNTATVRARLESVYNRVEENPPADDASINGNNDIEHDDNSANTLHYISDDEDDDECAEALPTPVDRTKQHLSSAPSFHQSYLFTSGAAEVSYAVDLDHRDNVTSKRVDHEEHPKKRTRR